MTVHATDLPGVQLLVPDVYPDARGAFMELWRAARYADAGIDAAFVQDNLSRSVRGVLRGLHFQNPKPQAKLVQVLAGEVYDVVVDVRASSPTAGQWTGHYLSADNHRQLYVPEGFAHGFVVTSDEALFYYKCTAPYHPAGEHSVHWNDPALAIDWPVDDPVVSSKDAGAPPLAALPAAARTFHSTQAADG
ncbi:dTDP-4-dehydrorhamnose 3,5-epimerase [Salisaeta longa]|uniref:dTDP-4-dehydrorhamnose 3,5-epimerase n=1 Tax=Salisaeta longa TaxID=503170 RepID=UPI0003B48001|nr:dTDP-4-dehydrorhamnose 3,5-epimerase [Salisaeta longa]